MTLFAPASIQTTDMYIMIETLERMVLFNNSELSQNVKKHWGSSFIKISHTVFLITSLFYGICSATRDCPKIYHDNSGSFPRILTSPQQCVWPIFEGIINGVNILYKFCKFRT